MPRSSTRGRAGPALRADAPRATHGHCRWPWRPAVGNARHCEARKASSRALQNRPCGSADVHCVAVTGQCASLVVRYCWSYSGIVQSARSSRRTGRITPGPGSYRPDWHACRGAVVAHGSGADSMNMILFSQAAGRARQLNLAHPLTLGVDRRSGARHPRHRLRPRACSSASAAAPRIGSADSVR